LKATGPSPHDRPQRQTILRARNAKEQTASQAARHDHLPAMTPPATRSPRPCAVPAWTAAIIIRHPGNRSRRRPAHGQHTCRQQRRPVITHTSPAAQVSREPRAARPTNYPGSSSRLRSCCPHKRMIDRRLRSARPGSRPCSAPGQRPNGCCRTRRVILRRDIPASRKCRRSTGGNQSARRILLARPRRSRAVPAAGMRRRVPTATALRRADRHGRRSPAAMSCSPPFMTSLGAARSRPRPARSRGRDAAGRR
jgi:hypothetical protein